MTGILQVLCVPLEQHDQGTALACMHCQVQSQPPAYPMSMQYFLHPCVRTQAQCHSPHNGLLLQSLQGSMADGGSALASMQRLVEERTQQASTAQQALMQLQQEHAHLTAHMRTLQDQAASRSVLPLSLLLCFAQCQLCKHKQ